MVEPARLAAAFPTPTAPAASPTAPTGTFPAPGPSAPPLVVGALAVDQSPAPAPADGTAFAPPLVELLVAEKPKSRVPKPVGVLLAVLLVLTGAGGWVLFGPGGSSAEAATYQRLARPGETHDYTLTMTMSGGVDVAGFKQPVDMTMNLDVTESILAVAPDGTSTTRFTIAFASVEANGRQMTIPGKTSVTTKVARDGRLLSVEGADGLAAGGSNPMGGFFGPESMQPIFPSSKLKPGDTWTSRASPKIPYLNKPWNVTSRNKLLRLERQHGMDVAVIRSVTRVPMNFNLTDKDLRKLSGLAGGGDLPDGVGLSMQGEMTFDGFQTVSKQTGRPIAVTGEGVFDVTMKVTGPGAPDQALKMHFDFEVNFAEVFGQSA